VTLMYDWAQHRLTVRIGYKTPILSSANDKFFYVFKQIVDDFLLTKKRGGTPTQRREAFIFLRGNA
jgi:hypothetical protein